MKNAPIVILTSALDVEASEEVARHFVPKPVDIAQLNEVLLSDIAGQNQKVENNKNLAALN